MEKQEKISLAEKLFEISNKHFALALAASPNSQVG